MGPSSGERRSTRLRVRRAATHFVASLLVLASAGCATTGSIRGTLAIPPSATPADSEQVARGAPGASLASVTNAVVYIERSCKSKPRRDHWWNRGHMRQTHNGFEPLVIAVPVGTTVQFDNRDSVYHNVFSVNAPKRFDTGLYAGGQKRRVRFDRPGALSVFCELHPQATGFIVVCPGRLFARPNARGEFRLPRLAEGTYTVKAWHPIYGDTSRQVKVARKTRTTLRLAY